MTSLIPTRLQALMVKEFFQIIRDPSSILISLVLPLVLMFLYGYGVSLDLNHLRLGMVLEDTAPDAQSLVKSFTNSRYFDTKIVRDRRELLDDLMKGQIRGFIVVPSYFSAFRHRKDMIAPLQVIADGSEPNTANFVYNYALGAVQNWLMQEKISENLQGLPKVQAQPRYWFNEQLESRNFLLPGSLAITMTLIGTLLTALVVAREWERGTMEALLATPVSIVELVLGKLLPYFILGMMSMALCVLISTLWFNVPLRGAWWLLALVTGVFLLCALGTGLLISTLAKNQIVASQISIVIGFLPAYMLSGFIFEIASMPFYIQAITYIIPARYFVQCLQTLFLAGNVGELILRNLLPMILYAVLIFIITARKTVKRLD